MDPIMVDLFSSCLNSNPRELNPESPPRCSRLSPPASLYDMHLDKELSLRRVELAPSLLANLKLTVDQRLENENVGLHPVEEADDCPPTKPVSVTDALTVADAYKPTAMFATRAASALSLHPTVYTWKPTGTALLFSRCLLTSAQNYFAIYENYGPRILLPKDEKSPVWEALGDDMRLELEKLKLGFPILALWQMFFCSTEAEEELRHMDDVAKLGEFPWITGHAIDLYPSPAGGLDMSPDAYDTAWGMTVSSFASTPGLPLNPKSDGKQLGVDGVQRRKASLKSTQARKRRTSARKRSAQVSSPESATCWPTVSTPSIHEPPVHLFMSISMLQHAWARAVERDSMFIVFHCGTFERIGFRHRASQTLFISDLIEPTKCKHPRYGRLHVGLFIAILKDSLDRSRQLTAMSPEKTSLSRKRKREMQLEQKIIKRPRTRAAIAEETERRHKHARTFQAASEEIKSRNLALLRIHNSHLNLNSFSSSLFLRAGTKPPPGPGDYQSHQHFRLHLTSKLEEGATRDAHNATIELLASNGEVLSLPNIVVKIAFEKVAHTRVSYIRTHDVGRYNDNTASRNAFSEALESIHSAGVRHRDIRAENMIIGDDGVAYIIDFDRAVMNASERSRNRELDYMVGLMRAEIDDVGEVMSYGTPRARYDEE
ncbi:hypothetical protein H0H92_006025 [Tricholoma furcatifolium]|nr:hypothetical protein H0H92_006025 [Tricholoma furcatifolium]